MASIALRRVLGRPFATLAAAPRWLLGAAATLVAVLLLRPLRWLGRWAAAGLQAAATAGCWLYLLAGTAGRLLAARIRRAVRQTTLAVEVADATAAEDQVATDRRPRVLIVCPYPIHPPNHGGGVRLSNLVRLLSREADLYLLIFAVLFYQLDAVIEPGRS